MNNNDYNKDVNKTLTKCQFTHLLLLLQDTQELFDTLIVKCQFMYLPSQILFQGVCDYQKAWISLNLVPLGVQLYHEARLLPQKQLMGHSCAQTFLCLGADGVHFGLLESVRLI